jgi:hypothetical protein
MESEPSFADLVLARDVQLWMTPDPRFHSHDECRNGLVDDFADATKWRCCPLWQRKLSNKLNAKTFARAQGVKTATLYWAGKRAADMPFEELPDSYVVKTSTGWSSKQVAPLLNGINLLTNRRMAPSDIRAQFDQLMNRQPYANGYILIEELLRGNADGVVPLDFKCFVFNGHLKDVQVVDRIRRSHRWYDRSWLAVHDQMNLTLDYGEDIECPSHLSDLIQTAETLSRAYDYGFVRLDLYDTCRGIVFGEFTATPWAGPSRILYTPFANRTLGRIWIDALSVQPRINDA